MQQKNKLAQFQFYQFRFKQIINMERLCNIQINENHNKRHKNTRKYSHNLTASERLLNQMQLSSDQLQAHIIELNEKGLKSKEISDYAEALSYFEECQRLLQMGADCGKSIDRQLILIVLSNEAFTYRKLNKLQNAKKYLQAVIFNIKKFLDDNTQQTLEVEIKRISEGKKSLQQQNNFIKNQIQKINNLITRKKELAVTQMQYAELLAEAQQHELSAQTAQKSIQSIQKYCLILKEFNALTKNRDDSQSKLVQKILGFPQQFKKSNIETLSSKIRELLQNKRTFSYQTRSQNQKYFFDHLKVEDFFIIKTKCFEMNKNSKNIYNLLDEQKIVSEHLMEMILVMAIACLHFLVGAELQQNSKAKQILQKETMYVLEDARVQQKQSEFRNKKAQKHYLFSLMLMMQYLPKKSQLLSQIQQIYKLTFQKHADTLWIQQSQSQEIQQMQVMNIELSTRIQPKISHTDKHEEQNPQDKFTLKVPNTNDLFLFDMASIDSIQCLSANSSIIDVEKDSECYFKLTNQKIEDQSYLKNPIKSMKYDPLFMGTWDLRQLQKLNKFKKFEQKCRNTPNTCQKTVQEENQEVKTFEGHSQQQVFQIIIHKKQKSPLKNQQTKKIIDLQKSKVQKTQANSMYQESVRSKNISKKKNNKNPEVVKQRQKNNEYMFTNAKMEKKSPVKVKFNKIKIPVLQIQKKAKNTKSKDMRLQTVKSKSNKKSLSKQIKCNSKSANKKNTSPPKNTKIKNQLIYYSKK